MTQRHRWFLFGVNKPNTISSLVVTAVLSFVQTQCAPGSGGQPSTSPFAMEFVQAHNQVRASVSPAASPAIPNVTWDATVASTAQAWANRCMFEHSQGNGYGENLYAAAPASDSRTPTSVVQSWASEVSDYDYANNTCSGTCGHYTQVVWRDSVSIGCARAVCTTNSPFGSRFPSWELWVCNYSPPGNFNGRRPY